MRSGCGPKSGTPASQDSPTCCVSFTRKLDWSPPARLGLEKWQDQAVIWSVRAQLHPWQLLQIKDREVGDTAPHIFPSLIRVIEYKYQNNMGLRKRCTEEDVFLVGSAIFQQLLEQSLLSLQKWTNYKQQWHWVCVQYIYFKNTVAASTVRNSGQVGRNPVGMSLASSQGSKIPSHWVTQTSLTEGDIKICPSSCVFPWPWLACEQGDWEKDALKRTFSLWSQPGSVLRFNFLWTKAVSEPVRWQVVCELGAANPCCEALGLLYLSYIYTLK